MNREFLKLITLKGKKALILGASKGIGLSCAKSLASMGAIVLGVARGEDRLIEMKNSLYGNGHDIIPTDLSTDSGINKLILKIQEWGFPDILIVNLYIRRPPVKLIDRNEKDFTDIQENLKYIFRLIPICIPEQRKNNFGRWIGVSSMAAKINGPGQAIYAIQKNAMESLLKTLAVEEGKHNITANIVSPGIIITPGTENNYPKDALKKYSQMNVLGRAGTAEEVANLISFLASTASSYITGVNIPICGGYDLGWAIHSDLEGKLNS